VERVVRVSSDAAAVRQMAARVDDALIERIATSMVDAMTAGVPEVDGDADIKADALVASRETARDVMVGLDADPWIVEGPPPGLTDLARTLARRGLDITVLMKLVRFGQAVFWPAIMETAEQSIEDSAVRMRVLATVFERFGNYVETVLVETVAVYQQERDLRMRGANARRHELIEALIGGEEPSTDGASRVLGYELRRSHTALALWEEEAARHGAHDALDRLEGLARDLGAALGARRVLSTPSGSRGLWAWLAIDAGPTRTQLDAVRALAIPPGLRAAIGQPGRNMTGFRRSHEEALAAQRIALTDGRDEAVTWHADVEIVSLLAHDGRGVRALVARELAGLTGVDPQSDKLRRTSLAYLRCACSATAAARELGVHTNTVRYRIEQAEDALGRPLQGQQLRLQLALMLVESVGPAFLPDTAD
jgi:sugar diacid utilization regulator